MLSQEKYYEYYRGFLQIFGKIKYKGISIAECMQIPLYYFVKGYLKQGKIEKLRFNLERIKDVIRYYLWNRRISKTGTIAKNPREIQMKESAPDFTDIVAGKVVFLIQGNSTSAIKTLSNVWDLMDKDRYKVIANTSIHEALKDKIKNFYNYEKLVSPIVLPNNLLNLYKKFKSTDGLTNTSVFNSMPFYFWLKARIVHIVYLIECMDRIILTNPAAIVTADDTKPEGKILTLLANLHNIKSFVIQHSFTFGDWNMSRLPVTSNYAFVYGEIDKKWYLEHGVPRSKLKVTGQPRLDDYFNKKPISMEEFLKIIGLKEKAFNVVLATNPIGNKKNKILVETCYKGVRMTGKDVNFIIKLHPAERRAFYESLTVNMANVSIISYNDKMDIIDVLGNANLVITYHSNVGLEALLLGKLLIIANLFDEENPTDYCSSGAALCIKNAEELTKAINQIQTDTKLVEELDREREMYLGKRVACRDGTASQKVLTNILSLLTKGEKFL